MTSPAGAVLVAGATGATGRLVVTALRHQGRSIRVLSRRGERARALFGDDIDVHEGDVRDPSSLVGIGRGITGAICATGTRSYFGANGGPAVDAAGTRHLVGALGDEVGHLVFLSAFGLDRRSWGLTAFSALLNGYFVHKAAAEASVRARGLPYTILRPVELRSRPPAAPPLLNQTAPLSLLRTVSRELVADVLVACLGHRAAYGKTFELCEGGRDDLDEQLAQMAPDTARAIPAHTPLWG